MKLFAHVKIVMALLSAALLAPIPAQADDYVQVCGRSNAIAFVSLCTAVVQKPSGGNYYGTNCTPGVTLGQKTDTMNIRKGQPLYACIIETKKGDILCGTSSSPYSVVATDSGEYKIEEDLTGLKIQYSDPPVVTCAESPPANQQ